MNLPLHDPNLVVTTDGFFDPAVNNGMRANFARSAVLHYNDQHAVESEEHVCSMDLLTNLLHFIHSQGESPLDALDKAREHFLAEACGPAPQIA